MDQVRDKDGFIQLQRKYSELYKKTTYLTTRSVIVDRIYEYDIRSANTSALRASGKFDPAILTMLESLDKDTREKSIGNMIKAEKEDKSKPHTNRIYNIIAKGIRKAKEQLFRANNLEDENVLSIKNDAVFVIGRKLKHTKFGEFEFKAKNQYAAYMLVEKVELYYDKRNRTVHMKGVRDEVLEHPDHQSGMIQFFVQVFDYLVMDQRKELREFLIKFTRDYKAKRLPHQYYRELNGENHYRTIIELSGFEFNLLEAGETDLDIINPVYNYTRFILPIIRMFM